VLHALYSQERLREQQEMLEVMRENAAADREVAQEDMPEVEAEKERQVL